FIGGSSAGAVTSLNIIYQSEADWEAIYPGITTLLGPLNSSGNNPNVTFEVQGIFNNWGMTGDDGIDVAEMVPSVAFHGVLDQTTPIGTGPTTPGGPVFSGSGAIHDYLLANNVCSELTVDSLGRHGIYRGDDGEDFRVKRATCFFKSVFCDDCVSNYFVDSVAANCAQPITAAMIGFDDLSSPQTALDFYPNPAKDLLHLQGDWSGYQVTITTTTGQVVRQISDDALNRTVDVTGLAPGVYFLVAENEVDKHQVVEKIVIQ
ncbi:MAG: T9SS type A sorting domain-containing protein, partial [Bacteroidota bacterium]